MLAQRLEQTRERPGPVRAPVQREVRPTVGVAFDERCRKVGRVRQHPLEAAQPSSEVRADDLDAKAVRLRHLADRAERVRVQVGRDDRPGPRARRGERRGPGARADL